ncbi:MAG: SoxR reducing system RseC family protein [Gammaproteobacteria bacterium]|nr:SoxR reducing system RseC family protein [Gammaproteobacteria bacterium]
MIEESARVIAAEGDFALVETQASAACGACSSAGTCSTSVISGLFKRRHNRLRVLNPIDARPGQQVVIGLQEQALVNASLLAYLLPLICMLLLAVTGQQLAEYWQWSKAELSSIAGGLLGLIIGLGLLRRFTLHSQKNPGFQPVILRRDLGQAVELGYPKTE